MADNFALSSSDFSSFLTNDYTTEQLFGEGLDLLFSEDAPRSFTNDALSVLQTLPSTFPPTTGNEIAHFVEQNASQSSQTDYQELSTPLYHQLPEDNALSNLDLSVPSVPSIFLDNSSENLLDTNPNSILGQWVSEIYDTGAQTQEELVSLQGEDWAALNHLGDVFLNSEVAVAHSQTSDMIQLPTVGLNLDTQAVPATFSDHSDATFLLHQGRSYGDLAEFALGAPPQLTAISPLSLHAPSPIYPPSSYSNQPGMLPLAQAPAGNPGVKISSVSKGKKRQRDAEDDDNFERVQKRFHLEQVPQQPPMMGFNPILTSLLNHPATLQSAPAPLHHYPEPSTSSHAQNFHIPQRNRPAVAVHAVVMREDPDFSAGFCRVVEECTYYNKDKKEVKRHRYSHFPNSWSCPAPECEKKYCRRDVLVRHMTQNHDYSPEKSDVDVAGCGPSDGDEPWIGRLFPYDPRKHVLPPAGAKRAKGSRAKKTSESGRLQSL